MRQRNSWFLGLASLNPSTGLSLLALGLSLFAGMLHAQQDRITGRIENSRMVALEGGVRREARPQYDQGTVEPSFRMNYVTLLLKSSTDQRSMLNRLLAEQQDPFSPNYHKWITPEQYADRFGLSQNDIDSIVAWLQGRGFSTDYVAGSRTFVAFSGTAEQVQDAFQTEIHQYNVDGETHFANSREPSIPAGLAPVVAGLRGLDDFFPKPPRARTKQAVPGPSGPTPALPQYTDLIGNHYLGPDDLATIYGIKGLYDAGVDGVGQKIVIVGQAKMTDPQGVSSTDDVPDLKQFRSMFNLPKTDLHLVPVPNAYCADNDQVCIKNAAGSLGEADLDLEWAGAVARNASLIYVYATDAFVAAQFAIDQRLASVITFSFGACEVPTAVSAAAYRQSVAQQANAEGITWVASSGDDGPGCGPNGASEVTQFSVELPASIPEVTGVGGTTFADANGSYWSASGSAVSYIPETAWNDTTSGWINDVLGNAAVWASGGGVSSTFPKPSWQQGSGYATTPGDGYRDVPDVAFAASGQHDAYVVCSGGCSTLGLLFGLDSNGGTSAAAPVFAGVVVLLNQYLGSNGLGNINPILYQLAQNPACNQSPQGTACVFHDVKDGDNAAPCDPTLVGCNSGFFGYSAGPGYDQVTGLGSVDGFKLANAWTSLLPRANTATVLQVDHSSVAQGGSVTLTATVAATSGTKAPTGAVSFSSMDSSVASVCRLGPAALTGSGSSATATATWDTNKCANVDALYASYPGDDTFNGSISQLVHVAVTAAKVQTSTTLTASSSQIAAGDSLTLQARVTANTGSSVPMGTVTFSDGAAQLASPRLDSFGNATYTTTSLLPGQHFLTALYTPDSNSNYSSSLSPVVTVTSAAPAVAVSNQMVTKFVDTSGCSAPSPTTSFVSSDQAIWLWFNVSGAKTGDVASAIWFAPDGSVYLSGKWDPLASGGGYCFYWNIDVAGYPPATSPGKWSVRVLWNGSSLFKLDFTINPAVAVTASMVTKSFDAASCSVPSPATAFLTTDQTAFLWFNVTGANAGDVPSANWYLPSGPVYQSASWNPVASTGNWCFWASIDIANNAPASSPGNWVVRVFWNGTSLFTQNFTILAPNSNSQPQVTSLNPSAAAAGSSSGTLLILGNNFLPNSTITFNGQSRALTGSPDARQLTIALAASDLANIGTYPVIVTNPTSSGTPAVSNAFNFSVLDPNAPQPAVTSVSTAGRVYAVGDQFAVNYSVLAGTASGNFDLMITFLSVASGNTYYYYDDATDPNSRWIHSTPGAAWTGVPRSGGPFSIPATASSDLQVTDDVPSGDYHVQAYFSKVGANQAVGAIAQTDFSVVTDTAPGTCFVATAAFGSPMAYQVRWLRGFRDRILLSERAGRAFVIWYYGWSPRAAAWLRGHAVLRKLTRAVLWMPVGFAWLSLRTSAALALLGFLVLLLSLGWSLRRGPAWWRALCLLVLVIGLASAHTSGSAPGQSPTGASVRDFRNGQ